VLAQVGVLLDVRLERGRLLDRLGRYDEAWRDFVAAKRKLAAAGG